MKTTIRKITNILGMLVLTAALIQGCSDISDPYGDSNLSYSELEGMSLAQTCTDGGSEEFKTKKYGKYIGDVSYEVDEDYVYVTVTPLDGWGITELDLYVSQSSYYDNQVENENYDSAQTDPLEFEIPLSDIGLGSGDDLSELFIMVYAEVGEVTSSSGGGGGWYGNNKWNKWNKWNKRNNKWNKWNKWGKKGKYDKGGKYCKKHHKKNHYCEKDKKERKYCDRTEKAKAKIHIENFDDCGGGVIGGGGVD